MTAAAPIPPNTPLTDAEMAELERRLDAVPAPLEPLDLMMLDGYLVGVLLQPEPVPDAQWLPHVSDADGRPLPTSFDPNRLHTLVRRRHAELAEAWTAQVGAPISFTTYAQWPGSRPGRYVFHRAGPEILTPRTDTP